VVSRAGDLPAAGRGLFGGGCFRACFAFAADAFEEDGGRFVAGVLRDELAGEGFGEDGLAEAGGAGNRLRSRRKIGRGLLLNVVDGINRPTGFVT